MLRTTGFAIALAFSSLGAHAATKVVGTAPGSVSGVLSYASGQYWVESGSGTLCVLVDEADEAALAPMVGKKIAFTGPVRTWSDRSRCIVVGPDFPTLAAARPAAAAVPVVIGAHRQPDIDACPSLGVVTSAVAVRLAPGEGAGTAVRLAAGDAVYLCGASPDGAWESVVVPPTAGADCGVSGAVATPRPYRGSCKSGWVPARLVDVVAG